MAINIGLLKQTLILEEGEKKKFYLDSKGIPTIGIGRNLRDVGIYQDEEDLMFNNDVNNHEQECIQLFGDAWVTISEVRQRVLIDMCFNLGAAGLAEFHRMIAAIKTGDFSAATDEMLNTAWAKQVGSRALRLSQMMLTNQG